MTKIKKEKKKEMKKLLAMLLAVVMVVALAVSATATVSLDRLQVNKSVMGNGTDPNDLARKEVKMAPGDMIYILGWAFTANAPLERMVYTVDGGDDIECTGAYIKREDLIQHGAPNNGEGAGFGNNNAMMEMTGIDQLGVGTYDIRIYAIYTDDTREGPAQIPGGNFTLKIAEKPALVAQNLDVWAHYNNGVLVPASGDQSLSAYDQFNAAGWCGFNYEVSRIGYRINGVVTFPDEVKINRDPGDAVKNAGGEYAVRYDMLGSYEGTVVGQNTLDLVAELNDEDKSVVNFFTGYVYTAQDPAATAEPNAVFFTGANTPGLWSLGTVGSSVSLTFAAPFAFNGLCVVLYGLNTDYTLNLINSDTGAVIDSKDGFIPSDAAFNIYFDKAHAPGNYTLQFVYKGGGHFVVGTGEQGTIPVKYDFDGFVTNEWTLPSPCMFLYGAINPGKPEAPKQLEGAYDELMYDGVPFCMDHAYTFVANPENRDGFNFVKKDVSAIYFRGWAQLDKPIGGFGYRIDGGKVVTDPSFVEVRGDVEKSFPGGVGYTITADVSELRSGEHTIELIAFDEDGLSISLSKTKDGVVYPFGVTFTVSKIEGYASTLSGKSFDKFAYDGVELTTGTAIGKTDSNIINKNQQVYVLTDGSPFASAEASNTIAIYGWAAFQDDDVETFGYRIDDGPSVTSPDFIFNRKAELKNAGIAHGQGFNITVDYSGLEPGEHTIHFFATGLDEVENDILVYDFSVAEIGFSLYDPATPISINEVGWWTGPALGFEDGEINVTFEAPSAFDGAYTIFWSCNYPGAEVQINLYDENDELLETLDHMFIFNATTAFKFSKSYLAGTYTLQYIFDNQEQPNTHLVIGSGADNGIEVSVTGKYNSSEKGVPSIAFLKGREASVSTGNASFDNLKYDETAMGSGSLYKWVADPANRAEIDFEEGAVKSIYFRGWAQLNNPISGFGYVIDDGDVVTDASFVEERTDASASFPGAVGYTVTVPVDGLEAGEHTIKIVAIDDEGVAVDIFKTKEAVDYPIALTFTVIEEEDSSDEEDSSEPEEDSSEPDEDSSEPDEDSSEPEEDSSEPDEDSSEPEEDSTDEPEERDPLDIDDDGEANNKDVVYLFRFASGNNKYDAKYDVDGDGEVNNKDVVFLFRAVSKLDTKPADAQAAPEDDKKQ